MKIYIDIDETICSKPEGENYSKSFPLPKAIKKVKEIVANGHEIVFWTARGTRTGINWEEETKRQLNTWGLGGIPVLFGKPDYDLLIDDKALSTEGWLWDHLELQ